MSSAYAVGAIKHKFKVPCGHMGTLDPMASGILPVGIGKTSRLFPFLLDKKKTYVATIKFGVKKAPTLLVPEGNGDKAYDNASEIRKYIESNK